MKNSVLQIYTGKMCKERKPFLSLYKINNTGHKPEILRAGKTSISELEPL